MAADEDVFTAEDLDQTRSCASLGPAYFAARRAAEVLFQGQPTDELKKVADKITDDLRVALYDYMEWSLMSDLESNIQGHVHRMVDSTIEALMNGNEWAMKR